MSGLNDVYAEKSRRISCMANRSFELHNSAYSWKVKELEKNLRYQCNVLNFNRQTFIESRISSAKRSRSARSFLTQKETLNFQKLDDDGILDCTYVPVVPNFLARIRSRGRQISRELATIRPDGRDASGLWNRYLPFEVSSATSSYRRASAMTTISRPSSTRYRHNNNERELASVSASQTASRPTTGSVWFAKARFSPTYSYAAKSGGTLTPGITDSCLSRVASAAELAEVEKKKMQDIIRSISAFNEILTPRKVDSSVQDDENGSSEVIN